MRFDFSKLVRGFAASLGMLGLLALAAVAGCTGGDQGGAPVVTNKPVLESEGDIEAKILREIDDALDFTYHKRRLDVKDQAAWQIIHGALAFKRDFLIRADGKDVSAVDYVLGGGQMKGWDLYRGEQLDAEGKRFGVRAHLGRTGETTATGQGHTDQWIGYLSDCKMPLDQKLVVEGKEHTLQDYLDQLERDVHLNPIKEYSWTIMAITAYRPVGYTWTAGDGKQWSVEQLMEIELGYDLANSPCGGTHRMVGLTMALNRHVEAGGKLEGVWQETHDRVRECIEFAKRNQNPDGSLSSNYFERTGLSADVAKNIGSAGHVLEFLTVAMTKEELREPWMQRATLSLCDAFRKTKPVSLECGALFHAAHGLVLYREKVFGPKSYAPPAGA